MILADGQAILGRIRSARDIAFDCEYCDKIWFMKLFVIKLVVSQ